MGVIVVTDYWPGVGETPTGSVQFDLTEAVSVGDDEWAAAQIESELVNGEIAAPLLANDTPGISRGDTFWWVTERIINAASRDGYYVRVPSAPVGSRSVADAAMTSGTSILTSATAAFTGGDLLAYVDTGGLTPIGTRIIMYINSTTVQLSNSAIATATGQPLLIGASVSLASLRV